MVKRTRGWKKLKAVIMKVKIRGKIYDPEKGPIMLILSDGDKKFY